MLLLWAVISIPFYVGMSVYESHISPALWHQSAKEVSLVFWGIILVAATILYLGYESVN